MDKDDHRKAMLIVNAAMNNLRNVLILNLTQKTKKDYEYEKQKGIKEQAKCNEEKLYLLDTVQYEIEVWADTWTDYIDNMLKRLER